jgi:hypothetical protein
MALERYRTEGRMKINVSRIISHAGEPITESASVKAYRALIDGNERMAKLILCKMYFDGYWTGIRIRTTDEIVAEIYKERGLRKPVNAAESDIAIVRAAVNRRVSGHIAMAKDILKNGMKARPQGKMEGNLLRLYDGYNRASLMVAAGNSEIDIDISK